MLKKIVPSFFFLSSFIYAESSLSLNMGSYHCESKDFESSHGGAHVSLAGSYVWHRGESTFAPLALAGIRFLSTTFKEGIGLAKESTQNQLLYYWEFGVQGRTSSHFWEGELTLGLDRLVQGKWENGLGKLTDKFNEEPASRFSWHSRVYYNPDKSYAVGFLFSYFFPFSNDSIEYESYVGGISLKFLF